MSHAPRPLPRRRFLQSAAIAGTGVACALGAGKMAVEADAVRGGASPRPLEVDIPADLPFAHGVASGDPLADSVILWTRVTPSVEALPGSGVGAPVAVSWQVSEDEDFTRVVASGTAHTSAAVDHTVHVDARGLAPARVYYYRVRRRGQPHGTYVDRTVPRHPAQLVAAGRCIVRELGVRLLQRLPRHGRAGA